MRSRCNRAEMLEETTPTISQWVSPFLWKLPGPDIRWELATAHGVGGASRGSAEMASLHVPLHVSVYLIGSRKSSAHTHLGSRADRNSKANYEKGVGSTQHVV